MKKFPLRLALATAILSLFAGFTKLKARKAAASKPALRQSEYYWYTWPGDTYNDENTLANEEYEMWVYYDAPVNTDPSDGQLIERGYFNETYPHEFAPSYFLYVHEPGDIAPRVLPPAPVSNPGFVPVWDFPLVRSQGSGTTHP